MLHQFWQNPFNRKLSTIIVSALITCGHNSFAQTFESKKGLIEVLQELIGINDSKNRNIENKIKSQTEVISSLEFVKDVKLNPSTVRNILFYSDAKFTSLINQDECRFLMMLETGLIKTGTSDVPTLIVDYVDEKQTPKSSIVTMKDYLDFKYKTSCTLNKDVRELFNNENWKKTLTASLFKSPKNMEICSQELNKLVINTYFPYIAGLGKTLVDFETNKQNNKTLSRSFSSLKIQYKEIVDNLELFDLNLLRNLYKNFDDADSFCAPYIASDVWTKSLNGEVPKYVLEKRCELISGKNNLSRDQLTACVNTLNKKKEICSKGDAKGQSLYPSPDCEKTSEALKQSRLYTDYYDCPSNVENLSLINSSRVIKHIEKTPENSSNFCSGITFKVLYELYEKAKQSDLWKFQICYNDRADNSEICLPYIPGEIPDSPIEEGKVLALAMSKVNGTPEKDFCRIIDKKKYNPALLEYSTGCLIITDTSFCTPENCERKIIHDKKEVTNITYKGDLRFDYFPNNFIEEQYSLVNMIAESTKKKGKIIRSLTDLEIYFKEFPDAIVHGVGCGEDLYPEYFRKVALNQCNPVPFIISGFQMEKGEKRIVFQSSIDELHSPRMLIWNMVFNSVANFKMLHPLNTWTLYGIK